MNITGKQIGKYRMRDLETVKKSKNPNGNIRIVGRKELI